MERYEREPPSPAGGVDLWGDLAAGLKYNRSGRHRALRMLLGLAIVALLATGLADVLA